MTSIEREKAYSDELWSRFKKLLACPTCHKPFSKDQPGAEAWHCHICGLVVRSSLGFPDFLQQRTSLAGAAEGKMDLVADGVTAERLAERAEHSTFRELQDLASDLNKEKSSIPKEMERARQRFDDAYAKMEAEIGGRAGEAILSKIHPYLEDINRSPVGGDWALEAGGGHGLFLPDFSKRFQAVVFLDCSLVNLVLARKLANEHGIANILLVRGDATALPFVDDGFDFVHENNVIEHVHDPAAMVKEGLRVTDRGGIYVCLSPNRYSIAPEPHFRLPCFGFFPRRLRKPLIRRLRGTSSEEGTAPLSLRQLRRHFASAGETNAEVFFLPRRLAFTVRDTPLRHLMRHALAVPGVASLLNGPLLWLMPYHIAVVARQR
jgi:ubiquinone/menaquinone biosynthesis C-methylase UbiE